MAEITHQPDWAPEGGWDNPTRTQDNDDGSKVYAYADGTQKHLDPDGNLKAIVYGGTEWQQYCECPSRARPVGADWCALLQLKIHPKPA